MQTVLYTTRQVRTVFIYCRDIDTVPVKLPYHISTVSFSVLDMILLPSGSLTLLPHTAFVHPLHHSSNVLIRRRPLTPIRTSSTMYA